MRGSQTRQVDVSLLFGRKDMRLLPLHRLTQRWMRLLQLFFYYNGHQVVTINDLLLLVERGRNFISC
jgi:hypothetical protein